jgi:glutaredoxin
LNAQVLGISVDHIPCLKAWADTFGGISYPLLSDFWPHGEVSRLYGVLRKEGYCERAIFIIDKDSIIRYIDIHDIDSQPDNEVLFEEIARIDREHGESYLRHKEEEVVDLPHGGVVMYCTPWCQDCRRARAWLDANHIPYREVDIHRTPGANKQVRAWAGGNIITPTFEIDGTVIVDFDEQKLREMFIKE